MRRVLVPVATGTNDATSVCARTRVTYVSRQKHKLGLRWAAYGKSAPGSEGC